MSFTVTILHSHATVYKSGLYCMYQMTMLPCQKGISDFITRYCIVHPVIWCTIANAIGLWNRERGGRKNFLFSCAEAPQVNGKLWKLTSWEENIFNTRCVKVIVGEFDARNTDFKANFNFTSVATGLYTAIALLFCYKPPLRKM